MSNAADLGISSSAGGNFVFGGMANTTGPQDSNAFQGNISQNFGGAANSQSGITADLTYQNLFQGYTGNAISFGGKLAEIIEIEPGSNTNTTQMDNMPILTWPKDQKIYYKLVGYNTATQTFETWIISENIVPRTETFDPTENFPNIDYNVFFTPPSGNSLVNIKIVGRWIQ